MSALPLLHQQALSDQGAAALRARIAPVRKHYQTAFGLNCRSTVSRHYSGEWKSDVTRALVTVDRLARAHRTVNPFALIAEMLVVAIAGRLEMESTEWLLARERELEDLVDVLEANARRMARHGHRLDKAEAHKKAADAREELAAINHVLHERERLA